MTFFLIFLAMTIAVGIAAAHGHIADSRDPDYGLGRIIDGSLRPTGR